MYTVIICAKLLQFLQLWSLQISPTATASELTDREKHPRFLRMVPPETAMAEALISIMRDFGWTYISTVNSNTSIGKSSIKTFNSVIATYGLCVATAQVIDPTNMTPLHFDEIIDGLVSQDGASGVVIFANEKETRLLLEAADRKKTHGRLIWLGTDYWGESLELVDGLDKVTRGAITLLPDSGVDYQFEKYLKTLQPDQFPNNPWYKEFWEHHFQCNLEYGGKYDSTCTGNESFAEKPIKQHAFAINTINAVYAFAHGVTELYLEKCGKLDPFFCQESQKIPFNETGVAMILESMKKVNFVGADGRPFYFTKEGDGVLKYRVLNYQPGKHSDYVEVSVHCALRRKPQMI